MHLEKQAQIKAEVEIKALIFDETPIVVLVKYSNYSNVFSEENVVELLENTRINEHAIKLEEGKQPSFRPIYNLGLMELKILKIYIKTNLVNNFIHLFKSPAGVPILFDKKPNRILHFYVDYWGFNNITIENWYLLFLISESLNWFGRAKQFT